MDFREREVFGRLEVFSVIALRIFWFDFGSGSWGYGDSILLLLRKCIVVVSRW